MNDNHPIQQAIAEQFGSIETTLCLSDKVVVITEDRLELLLANGIEKLSHRNSWIAPTGILASSIAALTTATFRDFAAIKAAAWQAVFVLVAIGSVIWLFHTLNKRRAKFGRAEFLNSIKVAGTRLNYGEPAVAVKVEQSRADVSVTLQNENDSSQNAKSPARKATNSPLNSTRLRIPGNDPRRQIVVALQCRQCGRIVMKNQGKASVSCSYCGALN